MKKNFQNNSIFGFTLIELLVVISIIGMLAGLLLPAINSARESGRRAVCISNQKQIAFQLIAQADVNGFTPLAKGIVNKLSGDIESCHSWIVSILPLIEEQDLAMKIKDGDISPAVMEYTIPILKCKSSGKSSTGADISYVVNGGINGDYRDKKYSPFLINVNGPKIEEIKSTSKTIILSENLQAGTWCYALESMDGEFDDADPDNSQTELLESNLAFVYPADQPANINLASSAALFGSVVNFINEDLTDADPTSKTARPSSNHPGIVISAYADGGVRPLSETIDKEVYIKLCQ
ncbi:MAG: DUF1559 domain-containing protein, partial [Planctomycetaceae bacterium]|nr:DUF1559 domain-containing protein [Planctomycetaceae bacterium]